MIGRKINIAVNLGRDVIETNLKRIIFTKKSGKFINGLKLIHLGFYLKLNQKKWIMGSLWSKPSFWSRKALELGAYYNINHLGNVYSVSETNQRISQRIEKEVIEWTKKRIQASNSIEGYLTSGGTESNLFLMWMGREWCLKRNKENPLLLTTALTHYSISKAGRILGINEKKVPINENFFGMDPEGLKEILNEEISKGQKNFLLPITLGYSSTGSCDPIDEIVLAIKEINEKEKDVKCFIWIDAAAQGLPMVFLDNNFRPFEDDLIKGVVIDFHKFGRTPLPSGLVLYRNNLRKLVERKVDYLPENDCTISGSRPGFTALTIWAEINSKSVEEWKKHYQELIKTKINWIKEMKDKYKNIKIIDTKNSLTVGLVVDKNFPKLPERSESKYCLFMSKISYKTKVTGKLKILNHYKVHFLNKKVKVI